MGRVREAPGIEGQGPWQSGENWVYVADPVDYVVRTEGLTTNHPIQGTNLTEQEVDRKNREMSQKRSQEIKSAVGHGSNQWSSYPQTDLASPKHMENTAK